MNQQEYIEQFKSLSPWDAYRAGVESAAQVVDEQIKAYPESVFIPPPDGQHGKTVDACSAAALRAILPVVARKIRQLAEPEADDAPIGKIRVQCIRCSEWIVCDWDDAFGFEDDQPYYMCGPCQRLRHFDHAA